MKILILCWRDIKNPQAGGSELYFHELAKNWVKTGNKVTMICGGWKGCKKTETVDEIKIIRTGRQASLYLLAPFTYLNLEEKPDVVIDVENGIPFFSPLFSGSKIFLHIHHVHKDVWFKEMKFPLSYIGWFLETIAMPIVYKNKKVITLSESSAEEILKEKFASKKPKIVNPGIEFYRFKKFDKSKKPSILFLNRIKKYKGLDVLLCAVKEIQKKINLDVWVAGTGDDLERMKSYAKSNKLKVNFLGRVNEEKKKKLMQKAWLFINPSFKEGWGIVNIEANYFGAPVIGSNVGGIKDSIVNGKTGILFEYGNSKELADKITHLIKNRKKLSYMSKEGKKWSKRFDWTSKADEYLNILKTT